MSNDEIRNQMNAAIVNAKQAGNAEAVAKMELVPRQPANVCPTRAGITHPPHATETTTMNATTKTTIDLAKTLAKSGFHIPAIEIHTPDGRTWNIATVPAGRGRHLDGHWGPRPGSLGGFRLFEIDRDTDAPNEHDAIDGDTWAADELVDYLRAVGQPKDTTSWDRTDDKKPTT